MAFMSTDFAVNSVVNDDSTGVCDNVSIDAVDIVVVSDDNAIKFGVNVVDCSTACFATVVAILVVAVPSVSLSSIRPDCKECCITDIIAVMSNV